MVYESLNVDPINKENWIQFLEEQAAGLSGQRNTLDNPVFQTREGDVSTAKDIIGYFLATLTGNPVEIN